MLVVDSNVVVYSCHAGSNLSWLGDPDLCAPTLLWPEFRSAVRGAAWRGEISVERSRELVVALGELSVTARTSRRLGLEALRIAELLGWARSYDAEYCALASTAQMPLGDFRWTPAARGGPSGVRDHSRGALNNPARHMEPHSAPRRERRPPTQM